jgi:hypothetical protein
MADVKVRTDFMKIVKRQESGSSASDVLHVLNRPGACCRSAAISLNKNNNAGGAVGED